jgi:hypothetical protein
LEFGNFYFYGGRKTGEPGEKPSWQGREPKNNSTHMEEKRKSEKTLGINGGEGKGKIKTTTYLRIRIFVIDIALCLHIV